MTICLIIGSTQIAARLMTASRPAPSWRPAGPRHRAAWCSSQLTPHSSYGPIVLPALLLLGLGMGPPSCRHAPATAGVRPDDAGVASAMLNTSQQVGGSIGTALLNTIAASATAGWFASHSGTGARAARASSPRPPPPMATPRRSGGPPASSPWPPRSSPAASAPARTTTAPHPATGRVTSNAAVPAVTH